MFQPICISRDGLQTKQTYKPVHTPSHSQQSINTYALTLSQPSLAQSPSKNKASNTVTHVNTHRPNRRGLYDLIYSEVNGLSRTSHSNT